ncbi:unnamed protein product [Prorocentrum cordatum]|uniref:Uncharacterized protein n=1 Tax=Prorocentrum cordatum TaxID=2364126 RepID=A0ABN9W0J1_9DINO|nr:unnamed protein product [Polarella glacialis]
MSKSMAASSGDQIPLLDDLDEPMDVDADDPSQGLAPDQLVPMMLSSTIPWFDKATKKPNFVRHDLNDREQQKTLERHVKTIMDYGLVEDMRGVPFAQLSEGDRPPYRLFAHAHLATAFYIAFQRNPRNSNVLATFKKGLARVVVFKHSTPPDIVTWIRDFGNFDFGQTSSQSFIEILDWAAKVMAGWHAYAHDNGIQAREGDGSTSSQYRIKCWTYVKDHFKELVLRGTIPNQTALELYNFINKVIRPHPGGKLGIYDSIRKWANKNAVFGDGQLKNETLLSSMKVMLGALQDLTNESKFHGVSVSFTKNEVKLLVLEVPTTSIDEMRDAAAGRAGEDDRAVVDLGGGVDGAHAQQLNAEYTNVAWYLTTPAVTNNAMKLLFLDVSAGKVYREAGKKIEKLQSLAGAVAHKQETAAIAVQKQHARPAPADSPPPSKRRRLGNKTPDQAQERLARRLAERRAATASDIADGPAPQGEKDDSQKSVSTATPAGAAKPKRKSLPKSPKAVHIKDIETAQMLTSAKEKSMPITWIECMWTGMSAAVADALGSRAFTSADERNSSATTARVDEAKLMYIRLAFQFAFSGAAGQAGQVVLPSGKKITGWASLRSEAKKMVAEHIAPSSMFRDADDGGDGGDDGAGALNSAERSIAGVFGNKGFVKVLSDFLANNSLDSDVAHLPCYGALLSTAASAFDDRMKALRDPKNKEKLLVIKVTTLMEFIASALNAGNPESEALQDKWLLSCKLVANVWANPQKYIDFAVPEAVNELFQDVSSLEQFLECRGQCVLTLASTLLGRGLARGAVWTIATDKGVVQLAKPIVNALMRMLQDEAGTKSGLVFMDIECSSVGLAAWTKSWSYAFETMAARIIDGSFKNQQAGDPHVVDQIASTAMTLHGISKAATDAQQQFDEDIAAAGAVGADSTTDADAAAILAIAPPPASAPKTVTLGTLSELISFQSSAIYADDDALVGEALRQLFTDADYDVPVFLVPESEVTAAYVNQICKAVESELTNLAYLPQNDTFDSVRLDVENPIGTGSGSGKKLVPSLLTTKKLTNAFKMFFTGTVSTKRGAQSFHIATISGVRGGGGGGGDAGDADEAADDAAGAIEAGSAPTEQGSELAAPAAPGALPATGAAEAAEGAEGLALASAVPGAPMPAAAAAPASSGNSGGAADAADAASADGAGAAHADAAGAAGGGAAAPARDAAAAKAAKAAKGMGGMGAKVELGNAGGGQSTAPGAARAVEAPPSHEWPEEPDEGKIQIPIYLNYNEAIHGFHAECPVPAWLIRHRPSPKPKAKPAVKAKAKAKTKAATAPAAPAAPDDEPEPAVPAARATVKVEMQSITFNLPPYLEIHMDGGASVVDKMIVCSPVIVPTEAGRDATPPFELMRDPGIGEMAPKKAPAAAREPAPTGGASLFSGSTMLAEKGPRAQCDPAAGPPSRRDRLERLEAGLEGGSRRLDQEVRDKLGEALAARPQKPKPKPSAGKPAAAGGGLVEPEQEASLERFVKDALHKALDMAAERATADRRLSALPPWVCQASPRALLDLFVLGSLLPRCCSVQAQ